MPRFYGNKMQRKMDVGAGCEDLRARCPYFYEVACKVHQATGSEQVAAFVNNTFRARYKVGLSFPRLLAGSCPCIKVRRADWLQTGSQISLHEPICSFHLRGSIRMNVGLPPDLGELP